MMTNFAILVIAACVCSGAALPRCFCPVQYEPVCGSDGQSYPSECMFDCAKRKNTALTLSNKGYCDHALPPCTCSDEQAPVCGTDGVTYNNDCVLNCATRDDSTLGIAHFGTCKQEVAVTQGPLSCTCPRDKLPVCASNGITYDNECLLRCAGQTFASPGTCEPSCTCPSDYTPVCGSDGVTYSNDCWLNCATKDNSRLSVDYYGACSYGDNVVDNLDPPCECAKQRNPVCGSDGTTYHNDCWLNCATKYNSRLSIAFSGSCSPSVDVNPEPPCTCSRDRNPVCGSNGITYHNDCWLNCATKFDSSLSIVRSGSCEASIIIINPLEPPCTCTSDIRPVCGSNGVTYDNDCWLNCATKDDSTLSIAHFGSCDRGDIGIEYPPVQRDCSCARNLQPVCGSDGVTYNNDCLLKCASQDFVKEGPCEPPCVCPRERKPVCGNNGITYSNDCLLNCDTQHDPRLTVAYRAPCRHFLSGALFLLRTINVIN